MGAAPVAPTSYRHATGEFDTGGGIECQACWDELDLEAGETEPRSEPHEAGPDMIDPGSCFLCGHEIERLGAPASLLCPDCENASCRCAA